MTQEDRRRFRRTSLRLRISRLEGVGAVRPNEDLRTTNVSAGGMFFHVGMDRQPPVSTTVSFELNVPPGEGYSASGGSISGSGRVVRTVPVSAGATGVAVHFTRPLSLSF